VANITNIGKFVKHLEKNKSKIAFLQLTGKMEDYLVKEYIYFICQDNSYFVYSNYGKKGELRRDICLLQRMKDGIFIRAFIEAKYLRNIHRDRVDYNAKDEIKSVMKSLKKQLEKYPNEKRHGEFVVKLKSKKRYVYGLVFASYVAKTKKEKKDMDKDFFNKIRSDSKNLKFKNHDSVSAALTSVYENEYVKRFGEVFYVTLKIGLWVVDENV